MFSVGVMHFGFGGRLAFDGRSGRMLPYKLLVISGLIALIQLHAHCTQTAIRARKYVPLTVDKWPYLLDRLVDYAMISRRCVMLMLSYCVMVTKSTVIPTADDNIVIVASQTMSHSSQKITHSHIIDLE